MEASIPKKLQNKNHKLQSLIRNFLTDYYSKEGGLQNNLNEMGNKNEPNLQISFFSKLNAAKLKLPNSDFSIGSS